MKKSPLVVALYLPQYYETEYNNQWWGKGYTEWTALRRAKPLYPGHYQPRIPLNNNYYDLSDKKSIKWQMDLAKQYGIDGFAIYQYYSCGKKLLEVPTEIIRDNQDLDLPFFLYWANESWRKAWFGQDNTIVWKQEYGAREEWKKQFDYCCSYFKDDRYIRIDGKPLYAIYNPWAIPNDFLDAWDDWAKEVGFPGMFFIKNIGSHDQYSLGKYSARITREPVFTMVKDESLFEKLIRIAESRSIDFINRNMLFRFNSGIIKSRKSYDAVWKKILDRKNVDSQTIIGCFCDWDNSPRKSYNSLIMNGVSPQIFYEYFKRLMKKAINVGSPMIVINAWNEWAEGAYLEPDQKHGYAYLEAIERVQNLFFEDGLE